ncbi:anti-sigma factor family protein [Phycisphaera mikurensis]|uniref:Zinc-finger domain-containing protein n=1 Tax=Phycisphaera mikurensis (strain NBRC 102666 / KCTC 22515 / FYK2301M01) TaxID=1142394 RepID=I0IG69_PHYMF|nr:hypothetical protein [Phycisphaera mikurensis]MBB6440360.1 hypothetical protein [Phycisphaera mikurensis]BAM04257.1 hypothetical protein PSMK_20980 [Phycisphaera mikurensis NBRC 102666]
MPPGKVFTLTCREASRLGSDALDRRLAVREALAVRLHRSLCTSCRRFGRQLEAMDRALHRVTVRAGPPPRPTRPTLSREARGRIRRRLAAAAASPD